MRAENYLSGLFVHVIYLRKCAVVVKRNPRTVHVPGSGSCRRGRGRRDSSCLRRRATPWRTSLGAAAGIRPWVEA